MRERKMSLASPRARCRRDERAAWVERCREVIRASGLRSSATLTARVYSEPGIIAPFGSARTLRGWRGPRARRSGDGGSRFGERGESAGTRPRGR